MLNVGITLLLLPICLIVFWLGYMCVYLTRNKNHAYSGATFPIQLMALPTNLAILIWIALSVLPTPLPSWPGLVCAVAYFGGAGIGGLVASKQGYHREPANEDFAANDS